MFADVRLGDGSGISAIEEIHRTGFIPHLFVTGTLQGFEHAGETQARFRSAFASQTLLGLCSVRLLSDLSPDSTTACRWPAGRKRPCTPWACRLVDAGSWAWSTSAGTSQQPYPCRSRQRFGLPIGAGTPTPIHWQTLRSTSLVHRVFCGLKDPPCVIPLRRSGPRGGRSRGSWPKRWLRRWCRPVARRK